MFPVVSLFVSGLRALRRDWRSGELRLLALALITAVAAVTSVSFLADRVGQALQRDAAQMLGGDLAVQSGQPLADDILEQARVFGLQVAQTLEFPSMVVHGDASHLVSVKAVSETYPLRGQVRLQDESHGASGRPVAGGPTPGTVWVDSQLLGLLQIGTADSIEIGDASMRVTGVIAHEPDRSMRFVNVAPRVLLNLKDMPQTGLIGPGSRVSYQLLLAGSPSAVANYQSWLEGRLENGQRISTLANSRPELQRALSRAHQFLALVALLTVMLAGVAVALATRQFCMRRQDGIAIMRCLGASTTTLSGMVWAEFLALALIGSLVGLAIGYGLHIALIALVQVWLDVQMPGNSWVPVGKGLATGFLLLLGFAIPPLLSLRRVPPVRVLRRDRSGLGTYRRSGFVLGIGALMLLVLGLAGDWRLGMVMVVGFAAAFLIFALAAWCLIGIAGRLRHRVGQWPLLRFALAGMSRRPALTVTQVCALAMGLALLILLTVTRTDLLQGWQSTVPPDAPNTFLINVQPDQRQALTSYLHGEGFDQIDLVPMVRARLSAINGVPVTPDMYDSERAQSMVNREFNLSHRADLPDSNVQKKGRWLRPDQPEVSLETGLADTLNLDLGDTLTFDFAGQSSTVTVVGLREVKWDSFDVNFFALLSESVLRDVPASYITSLHFPADDASLVRRLLQEFPNVTVFDIGAILSQVRRVLDQVVVAVQLLFLFTVAAGVVVLAAALLSTRDERMHEAAILRALGASAVQLSGALRIELLLMGALSGLLAAAASQGIALILARQVFRFDLSLSWWPWALGIAAGIGLALATGQLALAGVLKAPPLSTMRATS